MSERYFAGVDVYQKGGKSHYAIAVFNRDTNQFVFVTKRTWLARVGLFLCRLVGVRVMKETNKP